MEQLSLALENITLFQKTDISFRRISKLFSLYRAYKKRNDSTILARKVGLLSLSQKKCSPLHLDYYKLSKRFDGKYLGGILLILEGVSTARSLFTRGFISPLLEEERDRECKLSTKWRSIPLIKLHNTPVHGTTPLSLRRNNIYIRIDSRNVRSRPINERVINLSVVRAFLHVYTREGMKVEKRRG